MSKRPPYKHVADHLATYGRYGDTELVHLNKAEVRALEKMSPTGQLTINPVTGQKEAFLPFLAPLLGSMLGKAALGKLAFFATKPLLASAIGSGLGTLAVTRDPKQALISGLLGYGLGGIGNTAANKAFAASSAMGADIAKGSIQAANPVLAGAKELVKNPSAALATAIKNPGTIGAPLALGVQGAIDNAPKYTPYTEEKKDIPEAKPKPRSTKRYTGDITRYGMDGGEYMFFDPADMTTPASDLPNAQSASAPASGGGLSPILRLIQDQKRARGMKTGGRIRMAEGGGIGDIGLLEGPGDGQSDNIPARAGEQEYLLADGEYVVPADAVSALGNGSSKAGARELDAMIARVRKEYYGSEQQPSIKNKKKVMSA